MKTSHLVAILPVGLALLTACEQASVQPSPDTAASATAPAELPADLFAVPIEGLPAVGPADAPVTAVVFVDYECPYSARVNESLDKLRARFAQDLRVAFAPMALPSHAGAPSAARAALAAQQAGRFLEVHDALLGSGSVSRESIADIEADLNVSLAARADTRDAFEHVQKLAAALSVTGTPTLFINGRRVKGAQPLAELEGVVRSALTDARARIERGTAPGQVYAEILTEAKASPAADRHHAGAAAAVYDARAEKAGGAHYLGNPSAPRELVFFADFQCPYAARLSRALGVLVERHPELRVVLRHRPLPMHPDAPLAARAALAAGKQGKLTEYSRRVFAQQEDVSRATLIAHAGALGLELPRFERDLDSEAIARALADDEALADTLSVRGTPVSFVDGYRVQGAQPLTEFEAVLSR